MIDEDDLCMKCKKRERMEGFKICDRCHELWKKFCGHEDGAGNLELFNKFIEEREKVQFT